MSFSIKCNKCGFLVETLDRHGFDSILSDRQENIVIEAEPDWIGGASIEIRCKCGNKT